MRDDERKAYIFSWIMGAMGVLLVLTLEYCVAEKKRPPPYPPADRGTAGGDFGVSN
jgi:hypothetical protein